jgi:hypothetical protein
VDNAKRIAAILLGVALLITTRIWTARQWAGHPFDAYAPRWFLHLGPGEAGFYLRYLAGGTAGVAVLAWGLLPAARAALRGLEGIEHRRAVTAVIAGVGAAAVLAIAVIVLRGQVVTDDEYVYLFQSRLLAHGRAAWPAPVQSDFLVNVFVQVKNGRWFGQYPPGHPLMLLPGVLVGWPRGVPVILAAANLLLVAALLRRIAGARWAVAGALLLLLSPLFLLTGATLLSHPSSTFGLALACWAAVRVLEEGRVRHGLAAGLGLAVVLLARPYTAVTLGAFPAALLVWAAVRHDRGRALAAAAAVGAAGAAGFLLYNAGVSGHPLVTGYQAVRGSTMKEFGFGTVIPGLIVHTPLQGLKNAFLLAVRFHFWAWGWPLAALPVGWAIARRGPEAPHAAGGLTQTAYARWAAAMVGTGLLSYLFYWSIGVSDTGPVKTYEILIPFCVLTVLGLKRWSERRGAGEPASWAVASLIAALVVFWPPQLTHLRSLTEAVAAPYRAVERVVEPPAVVFTDGVQPPRPVSWVFGTRDPHPDLSDPVLFVRDLGVRNRDFWEAHPERRPYLLRYNEDRFEVVPLFRKGNPSR